MSEEIKNYFERTAEEFDSIYEGKRGRREKIIDKVFRKGMKERFDLTLAECEDVKDKHVLDIGCGSGRLSMELAKRGAYIIGLDFSQKMINIAMLLAKRYGLETRCNFICDDFMKHSFEDKFNTIIALGFFDYVKEPLPYLKKMKTLTTEKCIISFPAKWTFQTPIRKFWLKKRKCPVYFYTREGIAELLSPFFSNFEIKRISAGYLSIALEGKPEGAELQ